MRTILNIVLILPFRKDPYMHLFYDAAQLIKSIEDGFEDTRVVNRKIPNVDMDESKTPFFIALKGHRSRQRPHPTHNFSDMKQIVEVGPT